MVTIYIDADACPVKDEVYKVALRYQLPVFVVSNSWIRTPTLKLISQIVVDQGPDVADDWIAERADAAAIVITADIPLADRVLKTGGQAIHRLALRDHRAVKRSILLPEVHRRQEADKQRCGERTG